MGDILLVLSSGCCYIHSASLDIAWGFLYCNKCDQYTFCHFTSFILPYAPHFLLFATPLFFFRQFFLLSRLIALFSSSYSPNYLILFYSIPASHFIGHSCPSSLSCSLFFPSLCLFRLPLPSPSLLTSSTPSVPPLPSQQQHHQMVRLRITLTPISFPSVLAAEIENAKYNAIKKTAVGSNIFETFSFFS